MLLTMRSRILCVIYFFYIAIHALEDVSNVKDPQFLVNNISLKCLPNNEAYDLSVSESVGIYFYEMFPSISYLVNISRFHCTWTFKPISKGNYVELYFNKIQPGECYVSNIDVYTSGVFAEKICNRDKVDGLKYVAKEITLHYHCLKAANTIHSLELIVRETSPVNPGCDFKAREIGYRYHLLYEFTGEYPNAEYGVTPVDGSTLKGPFTLFFVNKDNLGVTACFGDRVIIPKEDVPSCHSAIFTDCGWQAGEGVSVVYEINDLIGYHWKVNTNGTLHTKSETLELQDICLYVGYLLEKPNIKGVLKLSALLPQGKIPLVEHKLKNHKWRIARLTTSLPDYISGFQMQLILDVVTSDVIYINKLFGCNPYTTEDRLIISKGNDTYLFGSIEKEFLKPSKVCKNGGQLFANRCLCPIGFGGTFCEKGCGVNKFGNDCASSCSLFNYGCKQIIFCDQAVGCSCASGFTGEYCNIECDDYDYGANCQQKCGLCYENEVCDSFTGYCNSGCKNGYTPPFCDDSFIHFIKEPNVTNIFGENITVTADINDGTTAGVGTASHYVLQYKENSAVDWKSGLPIAVASGGRIFVAQKNLKPDATYNLRILLLTDENQSIDEDIPFITFETKCKASIKYIIKLEELSPSRAEISWQKENNESDDCKVKEDEIFIRSGANVQKFRTSEAYFKFDNLLPSTHYRVRIRPILQSKSPFSYFSFTTILKCIGEVHDLEVSSIDSNSAGVKWGVGSDQHVDYLLKYWCVKILADPKRNCTKDEGTIKIRDNKLTLTNLQANREYQVLVSEEQCLDSRSNGTQHFITKANVPNVAPINGIVSTLQATSVNIAWYPPEDCSECNGVISGYHVELMDTGLNKLLESSVKVPFLFLEGLMPEKSYILNVFLTNELGWNKSYPMKMEFTTSKS